MMILKGPRLIFSTAAGTLTSFFGVSFLPPLMSKQKLGHFYARVRAKRMRTHLGLTPLRTRYTVFTRKFNTLRAAAAFFFLFFF